MSPSWVIVSGDVGPWGGQDRANHALASFLARRGDAVHLVSHRIDKGLAAHPGVTCHIVARPLQSNALGAPLLAMRGRTVARAVTGRSSHARVVVNGGNCIWPDVNWVHLVHRAWRPCPEASLATRLRLGTVRRLDLLQEARALSSARLIIANSLRTQADLVEHVGIHPARITVQYLGADPVACGPISAEERAAARARFGAGTGPVLAFVGALGRDRRKGFDTLLAALRILRGSSEVPAPLVLVAGGGALSAWARRIRTLGLEPNVRLVGPTDAIPELLAAADILVSPTRYEPFGLNVHEALCRGVPAIVSALAGVAERYGDALRELLLPDPEDAADLARRVIRWWGVRHQLGDEARSTGSRLRAFTWDHMAAQMVRTIEGRRD